MSDRDWTNEEARLALDMYADPEVTYAMIGEALGGISDAAARGRVRRLRENPPDDDDDTTRTVAHRGTIAEVMAEHGLDPGEWTAERVTVTSDKTWTKFVRTVDPVQIGIIRELAADMLTHVPDYGAPAVTRSESAGEYMLEIDMFDHHFGAVVWGDEVLGENYDLAIAERKYREAFGQLLAVAEMFPVQKILLPFGNDLVHFEPGMQDAGSGARTVSGTLLDADTRYKKVFKRTRMAMVAAIEAAAQVAPVEVVIIPGNHGGTTEFAIGDSLECWFREHPYVRIDNTPPVRKYTRFGSNLIGFTHGHGEKLTDLPQIMAEEAARYCGPGAWEGTMFREWHVGHRHRVKKTIHQPVEDLKGIVVRELPSLTPTDAWHFFKGFVGSRRGATAFLWHPEHGPEGVFSFNALKEGE